MSGGPIPKGTKTASEDARKGVATSLAGMEGLIAEAALAGVQALLGGPGRFEQRAGSIAVRAGLVNAGVNGFSRALSALGAMQHQMIGERERHHGGADRHAANADAGVMAAFGDNVGFLALRGNGAPWIED